METGTRQTASSRTKNGNGNSSNSEFPHKKINAGTRQKVGSRTKAGRVIPYPRLTFHFDIFFQNYQSSKKFTITRKIFLKKCKFVSKHQPPESELHIIKLKKGIIIFVNNHLKFVLTCKKKFGFN